MFSIFSVSALKNPYALGLLPENPDNYKSLPKAEKLFKAIQASDLPSKLDIRLPEFPVRDQYEQAASVAFAVATVAQNLMYYNRTRLEEYLSPQYIYNLRCNFPEVGMTLSDAFGVIRQYG